MVQSGKSEFPGWMPPTSMSPRFLVPDGITTITVNSSSLGNGAYSITYNTQIPNTGLTATMNFSGGTGTFNTITLGVPVPDIEVTAITFTGWTCSAPICTNTVSVRLKPTATGF